MVMKEIIFGRNRGRENDSLSAGPKIEFDCQPQDIGMPYNVIVDPIRLSRGMRIMGFSGKEIPNMVIRFKFR